MANYVYKYYAGDELLYVGKTRRSPLSRLYRHINGNKDFKKVDTVELYECENKTDMDVLERVLIASLNPPLNTMHVNTGKFSFDIPAIEFEAYSIDKMKEKFLKEAGKNHKNPGRPPLGTGGKRKTFSVSLDKDLMRLVSDTCEKDRRTISSAIEIGLLLYLERFDGKGGELNG